MLTALIVLVLVIVVVLLASRPSRREREERVRPELRELPDRALPDRDVQHLARAMIAGRGIAFDVRLGKGARATSIRFVIVPLESLDRPSARGGEIDTREWHVWQSLTERGTITGLPLQYSQIADDLGVRGTAAEEVLRRVAQAHADLAYVH